jgi:hypothetical protein
VFCPRDTGCISSVQGGLAHTQLWTFSEATAPNGRRYREVTWLSSANFTVASGSAMNNNAVTIYGDSALYAYMTHQVLARSFDQSQRVTDFFAYPAQGYVQTPVGEAFFSPESSIDLVLSQLKKVAATPDCFVRVLQNRFAAARIAIADQLVWLANRGCDVRLSVANIDEAIVTRLRTAATAIPIFNLPDQNDRDELSGTHDKLLLVRGSFGGAAAARVFTGSHNWTQGSNFSNDDLLFALADAPQLFKEFLAHYEAIEASGVPVP